MSYARKLRVAVIFGGRSAEHEVSILSASFVVNSLDPDRYEPVLIAIDKRGRFLLQDNSVLAAATRDPRLAHVDPSQPEVTFTMRRSPSGRALLDIQGCESIEVDVVFPVLHGPFGEDGCVQGLLELAAVPYVGASVLGSAVGMDKDVMKRLLAAAELPIVPYVTLRRQEFDQKRCEALATAEGLGYPLFVKPANLGSSVGIRRALTAAELASAALYAFEFDAKIVVEKGLEHPREIECALLGNDVPIASLPGEIRVDHPDGFYSYAAKYLDDGASLCIPADLTASQRNAVELLAIQTFRVLECSGLARVDFFLDSKGDLYVNEINTLPGFTPVSMYPKLWEKSGVPSRELVGRLVDLAIERAARRAQLRVSA